jgi:hypothetical protein
MDLSAVNEKFQTVIERYIMPKTWNELNNSRRELVFAILGIVDKSKGIDLVQKSQLFDLHFSRQLIVSKVTGNFLLQTNHRNTRA